MRAVNIGVGHNDDARVAQIFLPVVRAGAATDGLHQIGELSVCRYLVARGGGDVQDLAAQRKDRLRLAIARMFCAAAG